MSCSSRENLWKELKRGKRRQSSGDVVGVGDIDVDDPRDGLDTACVRDAMLSWRCCICLQAFLNASVLPITSEGMSTTLKYFFQTVTAAHLDFGSLAKTESNFQQIARLHSSRTTIRD